MASGQYVVPDRQTSQNIVAVLLVKRWQQVAPNSHVDLHGHRDVLHQLVDPHRGPAMGVLDTLYI